MDKKTTTPRRRHSRASRTDALKPDHQALLQSSVPGTSPRHGTGSEITTALGIWRRGDGLISQRSQGIYAPLAQW